MRSYNDTRHRSIGMAQSQVSAKNQEEVWQRLYGHDDKGVPKFRGSNRVRTSKVKRLLKKATRQIGAKRSSRYTRFIRPVRPCTD